MSGNTNNSATATDSLDSFNDDLVWILDRLVERAGGTFGLISRRIEGHSSANLLAHTSDTSGGTIIELDALAQFATDADSRGPQHWAQGPNIHEMRWIPPASGEPISDLRVLMLAFTPTQNVRLVACVCRQRGEAPFESAQLAAATRLYPVLARYIRLWWLHRMERRRAQALSAALDLSDVGVLMLDRRAAVTFANGRAATLLDLQQGVIRSGQSIRASDPRDAAPLRTAIEQVLNKNLIGASGEEERATPILQLQRSPPQRALIVAVMDVQQPAVDLRDPAVIIYLFDPEQDVDGMLAPACELYRLTGSEATLVRHLVSGLRLNEAAERMHVQVDTVRTYLKQVFAKTRTNRQVDLVRIMLASMLRTNVKIDTALPAAQD
jgi:DNA-binding CsgD family transcriptional regulator/PAS domain-containing protein